MWMEDKAIISLVNWLTVNMVIRFIHVIDHISLANNQVTARLLVLMCMQVFDCIYQIYKYTIRISNRGRCSHTNVFICYICIYQLYTILQILNFFFYRIVNCLISYIYI